jgi:hypothetical protein
MTSSPSKNNGMWLNLDTVRALNTMAVPESLTSILEQIAVGNMTPTTKSPIYHALKRTDIYAMLTADVIEGFSASLLQKNFDAAVKSPACHKEWWELFCSEHKQVAIAAPRRHAKTTAVTQTCALAAALFREREYVLIVSDTITQAIQFLGDIKKPN